MLDRSPEQRKDTRASQLVRQIREQIVRGKIAPGTKINIERLRASLDVSLSPLREALGRLSSDGLVEMEDNRGFRVPPLSLANLAEVTQLRAAFETMALRQAIAFGDIEWESEVMRALHRMDRLVRDPAAPATLEAWEIAHSEFHMAILDGCGMPLLLQYCRKLLNLNDRYRRILLQASGGDRNTQAEHVVIAEATVARNSDAAADALRDHIERTGTNLHRHLTDKLAKS
jgi:DNA-binding GntR family transcriptional regulator